MDEFTVTEPNKEASQLIYYYSNRMKSQRFVGPMLRLHPNLHPNIKIPELKLSPTAEPKCNWRICLSKNPEFSDTPDSTDGYIELHPSKIDLPPIRKRNSFQRISIVPQPYCDDSSEL